MKAKWNINQRGIGVFSLFSAIHFWTDLITRDINQAKVFIQWSSTHFCILKFIHLKICCIRKRVEAQNIQSWLLGSCCAACRIRCLCVCEFVKLNPATDAAHFNSTELVISTPRTTFLNFLLYAAGANNVIVCHRLALQTDCALMLHSFWLPSGSGTNGFLRHLL